ncbi:hypothetical protein PMAL9190_01279 [Photobacterium malacitanum]|uniref:DUF1365 domain-containing protein n=1 Tax=Photobacterium malacitanum TaxID=2204294 RepID=A0A1Y6MDK2_9GAMM|nr:DUF1365 domain-containing protein [Photobacterium malacitanum]SMY33820.1 hypothetical protein PMAL9190_01279 [Photobacterium malacitanum]
MRITNSGIYSGDVRHRRFTPVLHRFRYSMFMVYLDVDEINTLCDSVMGFGRKWFHFARFHRQDYIAGADDINQAVTDKIHQLTGKRITGKVSMLCHLRYCGLYFSPLNMYYVFDQQGVWQYVLAEVSNTPWNQRHYYAIPAKQYWSNKHYIDDKAFHVSPFNPMDQDYVWQLSPPDSIVRIHLELHAKKDSIPRKGENDFNEKSHLNGSVTPKTFDATLAMQKQPFTTKTLLRQLLITPIMTIKVVVGIYWQAFKLWRKGAPIYDHPNQHHK